MGNDATNVKNACIDVITARIRRRVEDMNHETQEYHVKLNNARANLFAVYPQRVREIWSILGDDDRPEQPKETRRSASYSLSHAETGQIQPYLAIVERLREQIKLMQTRHERENLIIEGMRRAATAIQFEVDEPPDPATAPANPANPANPAKTFLDPATSAHLLRG